MEVPGLVLESSSWLGSAESDSQQLGLFTLAGRVLAHLFSFSFLELLFELFIFLLKELPCRVKYSTSMESVTQQHVAGQLCG